MSPATATAVACGLIVFGLFKLGFAGAAILRRRAFQAGTPGSSDPGAGFRAPWLFWAWVGWRLAAAALALGSAAWLL